jgi:hypothetical protein
MARPQVAVEGMASIWRIASNILNKQSHTADNGWSSSLVLGEMLTAPRRDRVSP